MFRTRHGEGVIHSQGDNPYADLRVKVDESRSRAVLEAAVAEKECRPVPGSAPRVHSPVLCRQRRRRYVRYGKG